MLIVGFWSGASRSGTSEGRIWHRGQGWARHQFLGGLARCRYGDRWKGAVWVPGWAIRHCHTRGPASQVRLVRRWKGGDSPSSNIVRKCGFRLFHMSGLGVWVCVLGGRFTAK